MNVEELKEFDIIITTKDIKKRLLIEISKNKQIMPIKIMTLIELKKQFLFDYNEDAIYYVMNKYQVKYEIAEVYIEAIYYIKDNDSSNDKIMFLTNLKQELIKKQLLIIKPWYQDYLKRSYIAIYHIAKLTKLDLDILNNLDYKIIDSNIKKDKRQIREFKTSNDEIAFIVTYISNLIKEGIDISHIFIANINDEYKIAIKRYFKMFNIPLQLAKDNNIYGSEMVNIFLENYESDIQNTLDKIATMVNDERTDNIYNTILSICNKYVWCNDYLDVYDMIVYDLKHTYIEDNIIGVKEVNLLDNLFSDDDYVFLLGLNQGVIPNIYKDEDYLTDIEKETTLWDTSTVLNKIEIDAWINKISSINNLIITRSNRTNQNSYYLSHLNDILKYEVILGDNDDYSHSNLYNKLVLAKKWDHYLADKTIEPHFLMLKNHYINISYRSYNNQFTSIDKKKLAKYFNNKLSLSYSSIDQFYRCQFRYYINHILKLQPYEDTFSQFIGNLFHYILSISDKDNFDFDLEWNKYIADKTFSHKELFFLNKLYGELQLIIHNNQNNRWKISLTEQLCEQKVVIKYDINDWDIKLIGIIDKVYYKVIDNDVVCSIVDYKTGNTDIHLNYLPYGISNQLPTYLYLIHYIPNWENIKIVGFYLQELLGSVISYKSGSTYNEQRIKQLLLKGYSNSDTKLLSLFDKTYSDSTLIKSMKCNEKGFSSYAKVLSNGEMNKIIDIIDKLIKQARDNIMNCQFTINPKIIDDKKVGCEYCSFKDLCYLKQEDFVYLKSDNNSFLKEEVEYA